MRISLTLIVGILASTTSLGLLLPSYAIDDTKPGPEKNTGRLAASGVPVLTHQESGKSSTPSVEANERSPEVAFAMEKGGEIASGLSHVAIYKLGPMGVWISTACRSFTEVPLLSPVSPVGLPNPSQAISKPVLEAAQKSSSRYRVAGRNKQPI